MQCIRCTGEYFWHSTEYYIYLLDKGANIKGELAAQLEILPTKLNELSETLQLLIPVCNYYKTFVFFISQRYSHSSFRLAIAASNIFFFFACYLSSGIECMPLLQYLLAKGNTTCFEYKTGVVPDIVEEYKLGIAFNLDDQSGKAMEDDGGVS